MAMLLVPGFLVSLVTFPGVVVHEFAHKLCCDWRGIPTGEVVYFRLGSPAGYVQHAEPNRFRDAFVVGVAPFVVNSVLAVATFGALVLLFPSENGLVAEATGAYVLAWLGFSVGMHAFPSTGDASNLWARTRRDWRASPAVVLCLPVIALIYVANLLSVLWFDAIYALGLYLLVAFAFGVTL